jgi:hypothetical protein
MDDDHVHLQSCFIYQISAHLFAQNSYMYLPYHTGTFPRTFEDYSVMSGYELSSSMRPPKPHSLSVTVALL